MPDQMGSKSGPKMRSKNNNSTPSRPRPKTIHVESTPPESSYNHRPMSTMSTMSSKGKRGSGNNLAGLKGISLLFWHFVIQFNLRWFCVENRNDSRGDGVRGSNPTLSRRGSNSSLHGGKWIIFSLFVTFHFVKKCLRVWCLTSSTRKFRCILTFIRFTPIFLRLFFRFIFFILNVPPFAVVFALPRLSNP